MLNWLHEIRHTLAVTTYHPIRWGVGRVGSRLRPRRTASANVASEKSSPVLLVHGVLHNASAFYRLEKELIADGFTQVRSLELFTTIRRLEKLADRLKEEVHAWTESQYLPRKVRIVAHSLGGVVTRIALLDPFFAEKVEKVIFLGTPHQGLGIPMRLHSRFLPFGPRDLRLPPLPLPFPRSLNDLSRNDRLLKRLAEEPLPGGIRYWNLRGKLDLVTRGHATFLPHVPNVIFDGVGHAGLLSNRAVVQTVVDILETPNYDPGADELASTSPSPASFC